MRFRNEMTREQVIDQAVREAASDMWRESLLPYRGPRDVLLSAEVNPNVFTGISLRVRTDWGSTLQRFCKHEFGAIELRYDGLETSHCQHCCALLRRKAGRGLR